jgi:hypothetical protein
MKKSVSDVTRGTFYAISTSDTILKKIANSQQQNKIWYYNKQEFPPRPISVPDNNGPNYKLYTIVKPTNEQTVILDEAFTKTPSLVREETAPNPDDLLPKQSSPQLPSSQLNNEPEQIAEILKSQEPELPLTDQPKTIVSLYSTKNNLLYITYCLNIQRKLHLCQIQHCHHFYRQYHRLNLYVL